MSLNKDIKFSDYVKLTEMKNLILVHLNKMGMKNNAAFTYYALKHGLVQ